MFSIGIAWKGVSTFIAESERIRKALFGFQIGLLAVKDLTVLMARGIIHHFQAMYEEMKKSSDKGIQGMVKAFDKLKQAYKDFKMVLFEELAPVLQMLFEGANSFLTGGGRKAYQTTAKWLREWVIITIKILKEFAAAGLKVFAEFYGLIWRFRNTNLATKLGMGMNDSEYIIGEKRYRGMQRTASKLHNFDVRQAIADIEARNAAPQAGFAGRAARGIGGRLGGGLMDTLTNLGQLTGVTNGRLESGAAATRNWLAKSWFKSHFLFPQQRLKKPQSGIGLGMPLMGMGFGDPMAMMMLGMRGQAMGIGNVLKQKESLNTASLSAVEANTREGFAQRARARKEDEAIKLTKQQLEVLKDIKEVLERPTADLAPANLLGVGA